MTQVFESIEEWLRFRRSATFGEAELGFVPTMGALHEGHASLARRSASENARTLASIFVNPTQFDDPGDLERYPRTLERDLELLRENGVDFVILPSYEQLYPDGYRYRVQESELSRTLCGAHRPGHFDGVLSVVLKLLMIASPRRAYFGEKDYQQLLLVQGMARAFFLPVEIVPCPTLREPDGLAMSSRNAGLVSREREIAPELARALGSGATPDGIRARLEKAGFQVDYVERAHGRCLAAARLGKVRLIDNVPLEKRS